MNKNIISEMSWVEFEQKVKETDLIIIPLGVLEEHGHHNPLGTDTYIAEKCAYEIAKITNDMVAPVVPFGYAGNVKMFPGTISLNPFTYKNLLVKYAESFIEHGVKKILFINGHGGNTDILSFVSQELYNKHGVLCMYNQWWEVLPQLNPEWDTTDHGGYFETALMLYVDDKIVDLNKAKSADNFAITDKIKYTPGWRFNGARINVPVDFYNFTRIGNLGKPVSEGCNKELGEKLFADYVKFNVELIEEMKKI